MRSATDNLNARYPAEPESIPVARRALAEFAAAAGATPDRIADVRLAASEALTNVVLHGYRDAPGNIHIDAAAISGELWILISDDGCGMRVGAERPGLGMGLALISRATDEFTIVPRSGGGTEVRMRFDLAPVKAATMQLHPRGYERTARRSAHATLARRVCGRF